MRGKNFNVLGILFLFGIVFLSMNFVSGAVTNFTITTPVNNTNATGTLSFSVNATNTTGTMNVSFYWFNGSATTEAAARVLLCTNSSAAAVGNVYTCSINTALVADGVLPTSKFNITARETGGDANINTSNLSITVDNTVPTIFLLDYVNGTIRNNTNVTMNISIVDIGIDSIQSIACIVNVNGTNQTLPVTVVNATYGTCNTTTLSLASRIDGNHTINIYAGRNSTYWNANLTGALANRVVFVDSVAPSVELTVTTLEKSDITLAITATDGTGTGISSCTADRSGATVSGTTSVSESGLGCATSYTYVITCSDKNGHAASATKTVATNTCGAAGGGGGGGASKPNINSVDEIKPGAATVVRYTDPTLGVKQIGIEVTNPAQNVKITVTKHDGKPAAVSVAKTGKVYQYLQIDAQNLGTNLDKASVLFKVEKSWVSSNGLDKDKVSVYKFDESSGKWNELQTTFSSEDDTYYYYDAEVSSFSYFVISEKTLAGGEGTDSTGQAPPAAKGTSLTWLWILIALVIILAIWLMMRKKK